MFYPCSLFQFLKIETESMIMSVLEKEALLEEYKKLCNRQMIFLFLRKFSPNNKKFDISDSLCYLEYSGTNLKAYSFYFDVEFSPEADVRFKFERSVGDKNSYMCRIVVECLHGLKYYDILNKVYSQSINFIMNPDEYNAVDYAEKNFSKLTTKKIDDFFISAFKLVYCTTAIQNAFTFLLCNKHKKIFPKEIAQLIFNFVFLFFLFLEVHFVPLGQNGLTRVFSKKN